MRTGRIAGAELDGLLELTGNWAIIPAEIM